jgi:hypothetical protein
MNSSFWWTTPPLVFAKDRMIGPRKGEQSFGKSDQPRRRPTQAEEYQDQKTSLPANKCFDFLSIIAENCLSRFHPFAQAVMRH